MLIKEGIHLNDPLAHGRAARERLTAVSVIIMAINSLDGVGGRREQCLGFVRGGDRRRLALEAALMSLPRPRTPLRVECLDLRAC